MVREHGTGTKSISNNKGGSDEKSANPLRELTLSQLNGGSKNGGVAQQQQPTTGADEPAASSTVRMQDLSATHILMQPATEASGRPLNPNTTVINVKGPSPLRAHTILVSQTAPPGAPAAAVAANTPLSQLQLSRANSLEDLSLCGSLAPGTPLTERRRVVRTLGKPSRKVTFGMSRPPSSGNT